MATVHVNTVAMMQIFCVFSIFLVPTLASKETVSHGGLVLKDKSIMSLIKRLKTLDLDFLDESQSKKTGACESRIEGGSIIRATESINGGAVFLDSVKNLSSNAECYSLCCQNKSCDVAVYQSKNERYCYLFRCEDKCKFKKHANYTTNRINRPSEGTQSSEAALQNLNQDSNPDQEDDYQQQQQQQQQTAEVKAPTLVYPEESTEKDKAVFITPHTVGLGGYCTADNNCEDPNASCRSGTCGCSDGYYNKNGLCRKSCPQKEFECYKLGTLSRGPECIPENQVCDSYLQCADGSDEFNCEATANTGAGPYTGWSQPQQSGWPQYSNNYYNSNGQQVDPFTQPIVQDSAQQPQTNQNTAASNMVAAQNGVQTGKASQTLVENSQSQPQPPPAQRSGPVQQNVGPQSSINQPPLPQVQQQQQPTNYMPVQNTNQGPSQLAQSQSANRMPAQSQQQGSNPNLQQANQQNKLGQNQPVQTPPRYNSEGSMYNNPNQGKPASMSNSNPPNEPAPVYTNPNTNVNNHFSNQGYGSPNQLNVMNPSEQNAQTGPSNNQGGMSGRPVSQNGPGSGGIQNNPMQESQQSGPVRGNPTNAQQVTGNTMQNQAGPQQNVPQVQSNPAQVQNSQMIKTPNQANTQDNQAPSRVQQVSHPQQTVQKVVSALRPASDKVLTQSYQPSQPKSPPKQLTPNTATKSASKISSQSSYPSIYQSKHQGSSGLSQSGSSGYGNSQSWLDPTNYYMNYADSNNSPQRQQYYEPAQYYPQYTADGLDSRLLDTGRSGDDFTQYNSPYLNSNSLLSAGQYPSNKKHNSGYMTYPESNNYNTGYQASKYDFGGGEYGAPSYQDTDFYGNIRNPAYKSSPGAYEEFPSGSGLSKPSKTHIQKPAAKPVSKPEHKQTVPHESKEVITVKTTHPTVVVTKAPAVSSKPNPVWNGKNNGNSKEAQSPSKDTTRAPSVSKSNDSVFMSREKVIIASTTSNAEGPIIALSLGLAFTLILLVLVGCRMRTMRTRLRKGRPLNQNEADYLINGMYL